MILICIVHKKNWLCSLIVVHRIQNSASHHFYKILFLKKHTQKNNHGLDVGFFTSQNCLKKIIPMAPFLCQRC